MSIDELPVGGGGKSAIYEEFPVDQDMEIVDNEESKTIEERLVSKKWNVRAQAFEELAAKVKSGEISKDQQEFY